MSLLELDRIRPGLAALGRPPTAADVAREMRLAGLLASDEAVLGAVEILRREAEGAGILDDLLREPGVTDVLVNGPDRVWIDRGQGLELTGTRFANESEVRALASRLAARVGRRLDDGCPFVDTRLADGTRVHAILGGLTDQGTCVSLRVPSRQVLTLDDWVTGGALSRAGARILERIVAARLAFLISGGTGSGKTTLLATMLGLVPADERVLVVEDSRELAPDHPHCVRLEARPANVEGAGAVTLAQLVRQALRMRPDRVVVGEVRGAELTDLLTALNTGHEGGCGTVHANSAADVIARLEALASLGGWSRATVQAQAVAALDAVIHVRRDRGRRWVEGVNVVRLDDGVVVSVPAWTFTRDGGVREGAGAELLDERLQS